MLVALIVAWEVPASWLLSLPFAARFVVARLPCMLTTAARVAPERANLSAAMPPKQKPTAARSPLTSAHPLSRKLLDRPALLEHIRSLVLDPDRAHLVPYNTTTLERDLRFPAELGAGKRDVRTALLGVVGRQRTEFNTGF